jgi:hypothetical protein
VASSESSQGGIFHQASKFVSNVLGTSKKGKTPDPVKSLQLAAAAAKKVRAIVLKSFRNDGNIQIYSKRKMRIGRLRGLKKWRSDVNRWQKRRQKKIEPVYSRKKRK